MASKQDVDNAFYEGVCTVLDTTTTNGGGLCFSTLPLDMRELSEYAEKLGFELIAELAREQIPYKDNSNE